jgi:hypothetical protein
MSIFGSILSKVFGHGPATGDPPIAAAGDGHVPPGLGGQPVDVDAVLSALAARSPQELDWRHSIVDLMKLLGLDSGLAARQALARELHYAGGAGDHAGMNIWLHQQVVMKLAENGGKIPADLR